LNTDALRQFADSGRPALAFILHGWGGGVRRHVDDLASLLAGRVNVLCIEPASGATVSLRPWGTEERLYFELPADLPLLARVLHATGVVRLHLHHVQGLPREILALPGAARLRYDVTLHDYLAICPQYQLVTDQGRYCGEPDAQGCAACLAKRPAQWPLDITGWRDAFAAMLLGAARVIAPSADVAARTARYVPGLRCELWPHAELRAAIPRTVRVATLGMLSREKGFDRVAACAVDAQTRGLPLSFRILGATAAPLPELPLSRLAMTGEYQEGDLAALLAAERPDVLWFPAQWPETYTYTLSVALASGLPIVASDIGAHSERLAGHPATTLLPWDAPAAAWNQALLEAIPAAAAAPPASGNDEFAAYAERYLAPIAIGSAPPRGEWPALDPRHRQPPAASRSDHLPIGTLAVAAALCGHREARRVLVERAQGFDIEIETIRSDGSQARALAAVAQERAEVMQRELAATREEATLQQARAQQSQARNESLEAELGLSRREVVQAKARAAELDWRMEVVKSALIRAEAEAGEARTRGAEFERRAAGLQANVERAEQDLARAMARVLDLEGSRSWRVTAPLRYLGQKVRVIQARARAAIQGLRQAPRRTAIAVTLLRDEGPRALADRVAQKVRGGTRFQPQALPQYAPADAMAPLAFPQVEAPQVSIIVPMYGKAQLTYTCLASVAAETPLELCEVIVIDDASPVPAAEELAIVRGLRIERNPANLGFIGSSNFGADLARGKYLVFLNNDTVVTRGWLQALLAVFERHADAGLVGARLVYPDGRLQEAGGIVWRDGSAWNVGRGEDPERPEFNYLRQADYCSGACLAIPAALFRELGGFDRRYAPAYYEDTDLAFAVRAAGRKVYYQPASKVVHFEGQTSGTDPTAGVKRHEEINRHKFRDKWATVLASHRNNGMHPELERDRTATRRLLVIEACMLTPDQDAGSVRTRAMLEIAVEMGAKVSFVADNLEHRQPYVAELQARGIEVLFAPYVTSIAELLDARGGEFDAVIVARHYIAVKHLDAIRRFAPQAVVAFDTVDLHFLRAERLAELDGSAAARAAARASRDEELSVIRRVDVTLVVSPIEVELLQQVAPDARVQLLSTIHEPVAGGRPLAERAGIVFIGGFQHPPNTDAVLWYAREILPLLRTRLPGVVTYIVGAKVPSTIRALASADFVVTGFVEDIAPFFTGCRLSIAPLRYGAGVKGKVNTAMSYGLPVVATTAAVEGMHLRPGEDVVLADDAEQFAAAIERLYRDDELWQRLSAGGIENIRRHFSRDVARRSLQELFDLAEKNGQERRQRPLRAVAGGR